MLETRDLHRALLDLYLIARFARPPGEGAARGYQFERLVKEYHVQNWSGPANGLGPFRSPGASGLQHQVDAPINVSGCLISTECKSYMGDVPKNDLLIFNGGSIDQYLEYVGQGGTRPFFRTLVSATPLPLKARYYCYLWSIVAVDPALIPIPVILYAVLKDVNNNFFQPPIRREAIRALMPAARPLNKLLAPAAPGAGKFSLDLSFPLTESNLDLIADAHQTMSAEILGDAEESQRPLYFEEQAGRLFSGLSPRAVTPIP